MSESDETIKLEFLKRTPNLDFDQDARDNIHKVLSEWTGAKGKLTFSTRRADVVDALSSKKTFHRYFHCELQLLDKFLDETDVYDYFGCSKLSCFVCWGVLKGTRYRTRDTHAKVYHSCAFPFTLSKGESRYQLLLALKKVQDYMTERVLRQALDTDYAFPDNASLAETLDGPQEWQGKSTRHFTVHDSKNGRVHKIARTRAIRIPVDGHPVSELVNFYKKGIRAEIAEPVPAKRPDWPMLAWITQWWCETARCKSFHRKLFSEVLGGSQKEIMIQGYFHIHDEIPAMNSWCRDLIRDSKGDKIDPGKNFLWRGDLVVYRTIGRAGNTWDIPSDFEYIDEEDDFWKFSS
ncbi:hypothetical protein BU16DRAFT_557007 [Lophium mytilinum]|uniref:Uncharacterized protein n=1 Tax=Lophium mytilinum TaxID=390894 RepID=A0A6A6R821_9PEZI|nr:hypothetical protein BU16DRAFT_557007 [Lophium mytilinum]